MAYRAHTVGRLVGLVLAWVWAGAVTADRNFSQHAGFAEYFAEHPPAGAADQGDFRRWPAAMRRASICLPDTRVRSISTGITSPTAT